MSTLQDKVNEALDTAVFENSYRDLMYQTPKEVADDLCSFSSNLEDEDVVDVAKCVLDYQTWYRLEGHKQV
jgi:hypothetical protein